MSAQDFLVELGTEELPPKSLKALSTAFSSGILEGLKQAGLSFDSSQSYAAPRRLALLVRGLSSQQPDQSVERKGPALQAAFDQQGNPTPAAQGFARSCGVEVTDLQTLEQGKGAWLVYRSVTPGQQTRNLLPGIIDQSLAQLPIPKRMRWGSRRTEFVRPAHWLVMLYGDEVVDCELLGITAGRHSRGHRFHYNDSIAIESPSRYAEQLHTPGYVIADFEQRQQLVAQQVESTAQQVGGVAVIGADLLDEVTALVEWPVALMGRFDEDFLKVPAESLISSMKEHQKYFHLLDAEGNLMPHFITLSNIESKDPSQVISGNEKVIRPRLSDAKFFYDTDLKSSLASKRDRLKPVVFQAKLGSLYDKTVRIGSIAAQIAHLIGADAHHARRAGELSKADLNSEMVLEFADLQGTMGQYYARHDGEHADVCAAQFEQYLPRFSGDQLPSTLTGCCVSLADKLDSLVGIFGIGQPPSGNRDPFALRRATLGVLRILVEKQLPIDLRPVLYHCVEAYQQTGVQLPLDSTVDNTVDKLVDSILEFMLERFRAWYQDQNIGVEVFLAVRALSPSSPLEFDQRVQAVNHFRSLDAAEALAAANKRVSNLLAKADSNHLQADVDPDLLEEGAERALYDALLAKQAGVAPLLRESNYQQVLVSLSELKEPVDSFFDAVLVNAEDPAVRSNRHSLLRQLRNLFLEVADISLL
ncbi:glycine--tRNA ligase subunit beta [Aestuariirhabdus litorea]|uniref:Glycine--tRNA ligase beta subunit n=1 Tax=Aestuariirhabdus litorea TaxID=2528527 RepID=A0A3P3VL67_9GAMM|nr:glycine--tRNA ligase subunit beta [Aestuariirhabdus litorea]RRJ83492.1 glycine--tRNA ligase subunit beta [Aestuariirhabdus litorea]RWW93658.1 glycine--tRNA ligase subunit beta [Endozoicomonadaceae bacterium GTF-13]